MTFGGQHATGFQPCAGLPAVATQWIDVEERPAVERHAGEEAVVQRPLDQIGEPRLARDQQEPPTPHDAGDRGAGLAVGDVRRQLVRVADRLAGMARAHAAGQVGLARDEVVPLRAASPASSCSSPVSAWRSVTPPAR